MATEHLIDAAGTMLAHIVYERQFRSRQAQPPRKLQRCYDLFTEAALEAIELDALDATIDDDLCARLVEASLQLAKTVVRMSEDRDQYIVCSMAHETLDVVMRLLRAARAVERSLTRGCQ